MCGVDLHIKAQVNRLPGVGGQVQLKQEVFIVRLVRVTALLVNDVAMLVAHGNRLRRKGRARPIRRRLDKHSQRRRSGVNHKGLLNTRAV